MQTAKQGRADKGYTISCRSEVASTYLILAVTIFEHKKEEGIKAELSDCKAVGTNSGRKYEKTSNS